MARLRTLALTLALCLGACGEDTASNGGGAGAPQSPTTRTADTFEDGAATQEASDTSSVSASDALVDADTFPGGPSAPDALLLPDSTPSIDADETLGVDATLDSEVSSGADATLDSEASSEVDATLDSEASSGADATLDSEASSEVDAANDSESASSVDASSCTPSEASKPLVDVPDSVDHCAASPCANGATCENHSRSYTCHCAPGDYGVDCTLSGGDPTVQWSIRRYGLGGATYMPSLRMDRLGYLHIAWSGQAIEGSPNGAYATNQGAALATWRRTFEGTLVYPIVATDALAFAHAAGRTASTWSGHVSNNPAGGFNGNLDAHSHEQRIEVGTNYKVRYFVESDSGQQLIPGANVYLKLLSQPVVPKELLSEGACQGGADEGALCWESAACAGGFCSQSVGVCASDGSPCGHAASTCDDEACLHNEKFDAYWTAMSQGDDLHFVIGLYALGETEEHIFYTQKKKGQAQWSYPLKIESIASGATTPSLALDDAEHLHVAFDGHDGLLYYVHNVSGTWSEPVAIESTTGVNEHLPSLALAENGSAHVVWVKEDVPGGGDQGMLLEYAHNSGGAWSAPIPVARVTGNIGTQWGHNVERIGLSPHTGKLYVIFGSEAAGPFPGEDMFLAYTSSVELGAVTGADSTVALSSDLSPPDSLELCWEGVEVARFDIKDGGTDGLDTIIERLYFFAGSQQPMGHFTSSPMGLSSMVSAVHLQIDDGPLVEGSVVDNRIMFGALGEELTHVDDGTSRTLSLRVSTVSEWPQHPALHLTFSPAQDIVTMGESSQIAREGQRWEIGPFL